MGQLLEITDLEAAEHFLSQAYADIQLSPSEGSDRSVLRSDSWTLGSMHFDRLDFTMVVDASVGPLNALVFSRVRSGHISYTSAGSKRTYGRGDICLTAQPGDSYSATIDNTATDLVMLDAAHVDEVAQTAPGRRDQPVLFTGYRAISLAAANTWRSTYDYVAALPRLDKSPASLLLVGAVTRLIAATALATFPNDAVTEPTSQDHHDAHPDTLRRAISFIETNADLDISVGDIARNAYVSIRAVQLAFRRHLDTTPLRYLRRVRLDLARADLEAATPGDGTTVTQVAMHWAYSSPSRFAADYRDAYGEHPHRALQRR